MTRIRTLVVDDEPVALDGLRSLLEADPEIEVVGLCRDGLDAVDAIERLDPDLVLLDIQMPGLDGLGVARRIGADRMPAVVFVTAFDQHAIAAFEVHAVDYVLKPFDDARFHAAMAHAKTVVRDADFAALARRMTGALGEATAVAEAEPLVTIAVRRADRTDFVPVDLVDWIEAADYCVKLHVGGRTHVIRDSMHRFERRLDAGRFFRTHRSAIVNLARVNSIATTASGGLAVVLADGTGVPLSRMRRRRLEARLATPGSS